MQAVIGAYCFIPSHPPLLFVCIQNPPSLLMAFAIKKERQTYAGGGGRNPECFQVYLLISQNLHFLHEQQFL